MMSEYCERYAKKENISNTLSDESNEDISEEDVSDGERTSSDDNVAGDADPWLWSFEFNLGSLFHSFLSISLPFSY